MEEEKEEGEKRGRKEREDKGVIMATERDLYCLAWIAEQSAVRGDQVRRLLSRFPDKEHPFKEELIGETTVRYQLGRWRRAGWIEYRRVLDGEPGWAWVTRKGLALVDLDEVYTARAPAGTKLAHLYAVGQLRLKMDEKYSWKSERRYRAEELAKTKGKKGRTTGPIPDGVITVKGGSLVAVEAEITLKKPEEMKEKLVRLVRHMVSRGNGYEKAFHAVWLYAGTERIQQLIEKGKEGLQEEEQKRVWVVLAPSLIAPRQAKR